MTEDQKLYKSCSFCDKERKDVRWLIAGPVKILNPDPATCAVWEKIAPAICDECTVLAKEICDEEDAKILAKKKRQEINIKCEVDGAPGTYRMVRMVEVRDGEEIVRKPGQSSPTNGMITV